MQRFLKYRSFPDAVIHLLDAALQLGGGGWDVAGKIAALLPGSTVNAMRIKRILIWAFMATSAVSAIKANMINIGGIAETITKNLQSPYAENTLVVDQTPPVSDADVGPVTKALAQFKPGEDLDAVAIAYQLAKLSSGANDTTATAVTPIAMDMKRAIQISKVTKSAWH